METVQRLRARFPKLQDPPSDDICYATQNRQVAVKAMAPECELVIVVGSGNSSNSVRLVEVALGAGSAAAHLVDYADDIDPAWLDGVTTIGVTSGASVPEVLVRGVLERLAEYGYDVVQPVTTANETLVFALTAGDPPNPDPTRSGRRIPRTRLRACAAAGDAPGAPCVARQPGLSRETGPARSGGASRWRRMLRSARSCDVAPVAQARVRRARRLVGVEAAAGRAGRPLRPCGSRRISRAGRPRRSGSRGTLPRRGGSAPSNSRVRVGLLRRRVGSTVGSAASSERRPGVPRARRSRRAFGRAAWPRRSGRSSSVFAGSFDGVGPLRAWLRGFVGGVVIG